jgi:uncharacterized protein YfaS (alpha-2-macroglobulin family)
MVSIIFKVHTEPGAPTGFYNAKIRIGGMVFNKSIRIETIKPNRLKVDLDLGKEKLLASDSYIQAQIAGQLVAWCSSRLP